MPRPTSSVEALAASAPPRTNRAGSQTADRALMLLRHLANAPGEGLRLSDIAAAAGLDRATAHRLLASLVRHGFAEQDPESRRYVLGLDFFTLAAAASNRYDVADVARAALHRLSEATGDTVAFCQRSGHDLVCIDIVTGSYPIKTLPMDIGSRRPLGAGAAGIAALAALPEHEADALLDQNWKRLTAILDFPRKDYAQAIDACRTRGHGTFAEDRQRRVGGIAVALINRRGRPEGALMVTGIAERLAGEREPKIANLIAAEARALEEAMWRMPDRERHRMRWAAGAPR